MSKEGLINYDHFMNLIVGEISQIRLKWVDKAYKKLNQTFHGLTTLSNINSAFNNQNHPDVKLSKKTAE